MRNAGAIVTSCLLAACPGTPPTPAEPDAPIVIDDDAPPVGTSGLTIQFHLKQPMPVSANDATIRRLDLRAMSVRAIGDAAPGDARTTRLGYAMVFSSMDPGPEPIHFAEAPVGLYSSVDIQLAEQAGDGGLELVGSCTRNGDQVGLDIEADNPISLSVPVEVTLSPGGAATIDIELDAARLVTNIDWEAQPVSDGEVSIDDGDAAMAQIIQSLREAVRQR